MRATWLPSLEFAYRQTTETHPILLCTSVGSRRILGIVPVGGTVYQVQCILHTKSNIMYGPRYNVGPETVMARQRDSLADERQRTSLM